MSRKRKKKAASVMEYMALSVLIISALIVAQQFITRGLSGKWQESGDSFGTGRQYDPREYGTQGNQGGTLECFFLVWPKPDLGDDRRISISVRSLSKGSLRWFAIDSEQNMPTRLKKLMTVFSQKQ